MSSLLFDEIMQSKFVPPQKKNNMEKLTVIKCDEVSEYYYASSDKEYWHIRDFPNIAPPFSDFWLDFYHPSCSNSKVFGKKSWDLSYMPEKWGIEVHAVQVEIPDYQTTEDKITIIRSLHHEEIELKFSLSVMFPEYKTYLHESIEDLLKQDIQLDIIQLLYTYKDIAELYQHAKNGEWMLFHSKYADMVQDCKWMLFCYLNQKMLNPPPDFNTNFILDCWQWKMHVMGNGEIQMFHDTDKPMMFASPQNDFRSLVDKVQMRGEDTKYFLSELQKATNPFMECSMLALSFMHCKNVTMKTTEPAKKIVHNNSAKRRGEKSFQPVTFKTLNIKPMRKVLQTEGQERTKGTHTAMHICRGHFKTFDEKPLFGKYKGTYWWEDNVRGSDKERSVQKKYNIVVPQE